MKTYKYLPAATSFIKGVLSLLLGYWTPYFLWGQGHSNPNHSGLISLALYAIAAGLGFFYFMNAIRQFDEQTQEPNPDHLLDSTLDGRPATPFAGTEKVEVLAVLAMKLGVRCTEASSTTDFVQARQAIEDYLSGLSSDQLNRLKLAVFIHEKQIDWATAFDCKSLLPFCPTATTIESYRQYQEDPARVVEFYCLEEWNIAQRKLNRILRAHPKVQMQLNLIPAKTD